MQNCHRCPETSQRPWGIEVTQATRSSFVAGVSAHGRGWGVSSLLALVGDGLGGGLRGDRVEVAAALLEGLEALVELDRKSVV